MMSLTSLKPKLLLDEGVSKRHKFPRLNSRYDIKHIAADLRKDGSLDATVYSIAVSQKRLVVTLNVKDFIQFANKSKNSGIIGISPNLTTEQIDKKLTSLLSKSKPSDLYGKFIYISGEI